MIVLLTQAAITIAVVALLAKMWSDFVETVVG